MIKEQLQAIMDRHCLDAVLFFRPDELVMSMGYYPHWGLSIGMIYKTGDKILYIPEFEPSDIIPKGIQVKRYPWGTSSKDPFLYLYQQIKEDIDSYSSGLGKVSFIHSVGRSAPPGAAGEAPPWPSDFINNLYKVCPHVTHIDTELLQLYSYKSKEDIQAINLCQSIVSLGISKFYELLVPGVTEARISALMEAEIRNQIGSQGVISAKGYAEVQSGKNTIDSGKFNRTSGKKLQDGDLVLTEFAVVVNGYWADITRTGVVGTPDINQIHIHNIVKEAQDAALSLIKPGVLGKTVDAKAREVINSYNLGKYFNHALGHGVGFRYHDPVITIAPNSTDILKEGMVVTIEPGIYNPFWGGIRIEDNILITVDGYINLSNFSRELKGE